MKRILMTAALLFGCASPEKAALDATQEKINREFDYNNMIDQHTQGESLYDGFNQAFEYKATLLNSKMREAQVRKQAAIQLWDTEKTEQERTRKLQEMSAKTELFLSFFSPQKSVTNLDNKKTVWRIYLDIDGRRYIGDIKKSSIPLPDLVALYPYHNRWSSAYVVTFAVPTSVTEKHVAKFTLTGSVGTSTVTFPAD